MPADAFESTSSAPPVPSAACPSCAFLLEPPPTRNRLCPRCRQPIVVRRVDGRLVLLTEPAVAIFEAERKREQDLRTWTSERQKWLRLAKDVKAPPARRAKLAAAPLTADVVRASRALYLTTAERAVKSARHEKRWGDVGRIRREQAEALYHEAGSPLPPPAEIAELHREGMLAVLHSLQLVAKDVELVSAACCPACRADDEQAFPIATELRAPRLPHEGCPKGLCGCDWWPAVIEPRKPRRRATTARTAPAPSRAPAPAPAPSSGDDVEAGDVAAADDVFTIDGVPEWIEVDAAGTEPEPDPAAPVPDAGDPAAFDAGHPAEPDLDGSGSDPGEPAEPEPVSPPGRTRRSRAPRSRSG